MKTRNLSLILLFIVHIASAQNKNKYIGVKKIIETEIRVTNQDGFIYNDTIETNLTNFNIKGQKELNIRKTFSGGNLNKTTTTEFIYGGDGQIVSENRFIIEDSLNYIIKCTYDDRDLIKKSSDYINEGKSIFYEEAYTYNKKGKRKESIYRYSERFLDSTKNTRNLKAKTLYDKNGKVKIIDWQESDNTYKQNKYRYYRNTKGYLTKEKEYDRKGNLVRTLVFEYELDKNDHWTLYKTIENKTLTEFTYREIEYY